MEKMITKPTVSPNLYITFQKWVQLGSNKSNWAQMGSNQLKWSQTGLESAPNEL